MSIVWDGKSISVVVVPDEKLLSHLDPVVKEWTEEGILGRFFLVSPKDVTKDEDDFVKITSRVWIDSTQGLELKTVDLFEQIAQYEFEVVRVVSLRSLDKSSKISKEQNKLLANVAKSVANALPMANSRMNESQQVTRLMRINLLVSPTKIPAGDYSDAFVENWNMHVIASPEDRSTPWTADAMVKVDERYIRFILMHLASTAGLWNGLGVSPFELITGESAQDGSKWLSRVFVNAILTDGLSRRVASKVLEQIATATRDIFDSNLGAQVRGTRPIDPADSDQWVEWMVNQTFMLEDGFLTFHEPQAIPSPSKLNWLEWEQIKNFLLFAWDKLKVIPWWMYVWVRRLVGRKLTQTFQTDEGLAEIGIAQEDAMDLRDQELIYQLATIKEHSEVARAAMTATESQRSVKATPRLWSGIRRLLFGMLDGSDLSEFGIQETEGLVPVFTNTSQVITDPSDAFKIPLEYRQELRLEQITWSNINQVDPLLRVISDRLATLKAKQNETISELEKLNKEIDSAEAKAGGY